MKTILVLISMLLGVSAYANTETCLKTLEAKYKNDAKMSSDWGFEGVSTLSLKQAKTMIKDALPDDGVKARATMQGLLNDKNVQFYTLQWNAPSNTGITIIAADKRSCSVVADLLYWSEE